MQSLHDVCTQSIDKKNGVKYCSAFQMADDKEEYIHLQFFIKLEETSFGKPALFQTAFGNEAVHYANKISVLSKV